MGPAVPQRDARRRVRHGRDLGNPREKAPQISFFSPFYSLHRSPLAVQTLLEVQDAAVPTQG